MQNCKYPAHMQAVSSTTKSGNIANGSRANKLYSIDLSTDPYLQSFSTSNKVLIISAFAHALRSAKFSKPTICRLGEDSVRNSVDHVAQTFRDHQYPDPRLDPDGKPSRLLSTQYRSYCNDDPPTKHQKALPGCALLRLYRHTKTERLRAIADLCTGAFFFAMRSCEYLSVSGPQRKTKRLRLANLRFFLKNKELPLLSKHLLSATVISITFEDQKNDQNSTPSPCILHHTTFFARSKLGPK